MRAVSVLLAACALAVKSDPVAELDACAANLEEELADQSAALAAETAKLGKLGDAVEVFGKGLEQRRDALSNRMKALEETESLRNAYSDVVRASETEVAQMRANMPADDIAWAAALELQDAKLTEERERLGALQEQVAGELRDLEQLSQAWQQDKKQFATFKESLEDKLAAKAKLEVAVDSLESESEKLRQEVTDSKAKVDTLHEGEKAALEAELHEATAEPTTEERFEQVQENVASGMEGAISEFAKALQEANPPEEKAAEETVTTTTTEGMN